MLSLDKGLVCCDVLLNAFAQNSLPLVASNGWAPAVSKSNSDEQTFETMGYLRLLA